MKPAYLDKNDQISIISPSGAVAAEYIDGSKKLLESWGYECLVGKHAKNCWGRFAGTKEERISDLQTALDNLNTKAILCSRGGYGLSQIIDSIDFSGFIEHPKWLIGFSDISILHNAIGNLGFASIHALMAKHLTQLPATSLELQAWRNMISGKLPIYKSEAHPLNREGLVEGKLIGGNLSVLCSMRGTRYDLNYRGNILFIEDIGEQAYHIDRMIQNLRLGAVFEQIKGLIVGQLSDCEEDPLMNISIAESIKEATKQYDYPVAFNFPAGHVDNNLPLMLGADINLEVNDQGMTLNWK